jgi:hydrogenase expression/formation protein HypC
MWVVERYGHLARCEVNRVERTVSLFLLQHESIEPGDPVMVDVGYAIQKMNPADARSVWDALDEAFAAVDASDA